MVLLISFILFAHSVETAPTGIITVDLTHEYDSDMPLYPGQEPFAMTVIKNGSFEGKNWFQTEKVKTRTHMGTHLDAPAHYTYGGLTADQIPMSRLIAQASVIDIERRAARDRNAEVTVADLEHWERTTGQSLDGTIVLVSSGWGKRWSNRTEYLGTNGGNGPEVLSFPSFSPEAARWLVDNRNVNGIGVDTISLDKGIAKHFPIHNIILNNGLFALENVANVDKIPTSGATLYVMPMKIARASAAPTRIVATFAKNQLEILEDK